MGYQKILVTLDGSKLSELALQHVLKIVDPYASIHILSVIAEGPTTEVSSLASAMAYPAPESAEAWPPTKIGDPHKIGAREKYVQQVSDFLEEAGYHISIEVRQGPVIETILKVAERGFDIIVMVTHGHTGMNKVVLGSVTEAVLRESPCPVLVIKANNAPAES